MYEHDKTKSSILFLPDMIPLLKDTLGIKNSVVKRKKNYNKKWAKKYLKTERKTIGKIKGYLAKFSG